MLSPFACPLDFLLLHISLGTPPAPLRGATKGYIWNTSVDQYSYTHAHVPVNACLHVFCQADVIHMRTLTHESKFILRITTKLW